VIKDSKRISYQFFFWATFFLIRSSSSLSEIFSLLSTLEWLIVPSDFFLPLSVQSSAPHHLYHSRISKRGERNSIQSNATERLFTERGEYIIAHKREG
jgi:hypothetical protein